MFQNNVCFAYDKIMFQLIFTNCLFEKKTWKYTVIATVHDFSAWVSNSGTTFLVHEITHMLTNQWENETMMTINSNWLAELIGRISSATTSVQHPPGG